MFLLHVIINMCRILVNVPDENQQAFKDPLHVPVGPITKARSKKIKEALNGLIQEIWAASKAFIIYNVFLAIFLF